MNHLLSMNPLFGVLPFMNMKPNTPLRLRLALLFTWPALSTLHMPAAEPAPASLRIFADARAPQPIPRLMTGKFAEHLGNNIYNGMDAQVLRNPTFAAYPFWTGEMNPDGVTMFHYEREKITQNIRRGASFQGWPDAELDRLVEAYHDGLACWWTRLGPREAVQVSPDTGSHGGRAQRVEVKAAGQGLAQWTYLPLHRTRKFEFELYVRAIGLGRLTVSLSGAGDSQPEAHATVDGLKADWRKLTGTLEVPAGLPAAAAYRLAIVADGPGQFVLGRALLRPADHLQGADPEVVRLLKDSRLPLLRWPGGNFVSGYHWEEGIGPFERRPTRPNYAWGGVEPNLFGTDEFIAFCRAVGCEPMICVNGGEGTPEEAARWVEYCNGSAKTPMGRLRAAHGHPQPYHIRYWEVGNELWGRWQFNWTTASGYVDRYQRFSRALLAADPKIVIYACGAPVMWGKAWNDTLIAGTAPTLRAITDHPLVGGTVSASVEPLDVYRDFMAVPVVLERKWAALRDDMARAGIKEARLAVTELQMFAHRGPPGTNEPARLTQANLVNPATLGEALYDVLLYHAAVRLAPFVDFVTHSAIVNHGGGLRKEHERVYANPCHHAQAAFAAFAGATPVRFELEAATERAPLVLPELRNVTRGESFKTVDALAALTPAGDLLLSIVHRGSAGPTRLAIDLRDFAAAERAQVRSLAGPVPWAANSLSNPDAVQPADVSVEVREGRLTIDLEPYSVLRVRVPKARPPSSR
jgi:alpha-L-arabinofuranosidase